MIRSLFRDSDKLINTEDEQYIGRMRRDIDTLRRDKDREHRKYLALFRAIEKEFGRDKAYDLSEKAYEEYKAEA